MDHATSPDADANRPADDLSITAADADADAARPWWDRLTPRAGVRVQLFAAAAVWLVGVSFLLIRGVLYMVEPGGGFHVSYLIVPVVLVAVVIGVVKARFVLIRYANKAVARIRRRGRACFFGFFSLRSWLFVAVMMGGGLTLRHSALVDFSWGRVALATLYIAVGTALAIADRIFWMAALRPGPFVTEAAANDRAQVTGEQAGAADERPGAADQLPRPDGSATA